MSKAPGKKRDMILAVGNNRNCNDLRIFVIYKLKDVSQESAIFDHVNECISALFPIQFHIVSTDPHS